MADNVPSGSTRLYTDAWQSYRGSPPGHATVAHGVREWARDDNSDGQREGYTLYRGTGVQSYGLLTRDEESVIEGTLEEIETWLSNPP